MCVVTRQTPKGDLPGLLLDALRPIQRRLHAERTLSSGKLGILRRLVETDRATAGDLAKRLHVSPQAVSLSTRELEDLGLIARARDDEDRRRIWFAITNAGRARYEEEQLVGQVWLERVIAEQLTRAEVRALAAAVPALAKLVDEGADD